VTYVSNSWMLDKRVVDSNSKRSTTCGYRKVFSNSTPCEQTRPVNLPNSILEVRLSNHSLDSELRGWTFS
jgi:hypothetical protein